MDAAAPVCPLCRNDVDRRDALYCRNKACTGVAHWSCTACWQAQHYHEVRCLNCRDRFPEMQRRALASFKKFRSRPRDGSFRAPQLRFVSEEDDDGADRSTDSETEPDTDSEPELEQEPQPAPQPVRRRTLTHNQVLWIFTLVMLVSALWSFFVRGRGSSHHTPQPPPRLFL
jgi:hypothetical protein